MRVNQRTNDTVGDRQWDSAKQLSRVGLVAEGIQGDHAATLGHTPADRFFAQRESSSFRLWRVEPSETDPNLSRIVAAVTKP
jgi:hypothetical protein